MDLHGVMAYLCSLVKKLIIFSKFHSFQLFSLELSSAQFAVANRK